MLAVQLYSGETPLGHVHSKDFVTLVVDMDVRPERPDEADAPELSDEIWDLAERCWTRNPKERLTAPVVCEDLARFMDRGLQVSQASHPALPPPTNARPAVPACLRPSFVNPALEPKYTPQAFAPSHPPTGRRIRASSLVGVNAGAIRTTVGVAQDIRAEQLDASYSEKPHPRRPLGLFLGLQSQLYPRAEVTQNCGSISRFSSTCRLAV